MVDTNQSKELVLPPGTVAFVLDRTKGRVSAAVGPHKSSLSDTDQLVAWDAAHGRYVNVENTAASQSGFIVARQGEYIILTNPSAAGTSDHPPIGQTTDTFALDVGRRVIIPGPAAFPLWPGQEAQVLAGHHMRHNQYVLVRVYDADLARENWSQAVMAPQTKVPDLTEEELAALSDDDRAVHLAAQAEAATTSPVLSEPPREFTMGQLIVVQGTDVSFYMPSTGMEVVPEGGTLSNYTNTGGTYVRDAVTLETLEYCILLDENGQKRYVRGPAVVFPKPTEQFKQNDNGSKVFDAIELNEQSGLYIKVIEDYVDDNHVTHKAGEELFITGADAPIYFPNAQSTIIMYGNKRKHHAIAVPAGEGRYVLDRRNGDVKLVTGPTMLLPDPRHEVIVRRILAPHDVQTMFPGNIEALRTNERYLAEQASVGSDYLENAEMLRGATRAGGRARYAANENVVVASAAMPQNYTEDAIARGTTYSAPRTITLDTKYEGAVAISPFPGYAVLITDKEGNRRVEVGPKVVLLDYDESIMALSLSTGRPKSDAKLLRTGYLRIINNVVSDIVEVETKDLVSLSLEVSYRVNFTGETSEEQEKWFNVENYVQVLTDHCRSKLRNAAKRYEILDFYTNAIDIVRDTLLGVVEGEGHRHNLTFEENGMQVYDVEVLGVDIETDGVEELLIGAQKDALEGAIELTMAKGNTQRQGELEALARKVLTEMSLTAQAKAEAALAAQQLETDRQVALREGELVIRQKKLAIEEADRENVRLDAEQGVALQRERDEQEIARMRAETEQVVARAQGLTPEMIAALQAYGGNELVEKIVTTIGPAALASGVTTADMLTAVFEGTPLESIVSALAKRPGVPVTNSN